MQLKNIILNLIVFIFSTSLFAQLDNNKVEETNAFSFQPDPENNEIKMSIAPSNTVKNEGEIITRFGTLNDISNNFPGHSVLKSKRTNSMQDLVNSEVDVLYKKFWNGKDVSDVKLKTKLELGKLETNTQRIRIEYRDHSYVDGDRVRVYLNEKILRSNVTLQAGFLSIDINLLEGFNRIDIEALNQGSSGPNTAEFRVFDGKGNLLADQEWNILTGNIATLVVMKI
jgi:hypothetical protein